MTIKIEPTVHMDCVGSINLMQAMDGKLKREEEDCLCWSHSQATPSFYLTVISQRLQDKIWE